MKQGWYRLTHGRSHLIVYIDKSGTPTCFINLGWMSLPEFPYDVLPLEYEYGNSFEPWMNKVDEWVRKHEPSKRHERNYGLTVAIGSHSTEGWLKDTKDYGLYLHSPTPKLIPLLEPLNLADIINIDL